MSKRDLLAAAATATILGVGSLILQRWVAETRQAAMALVVAWFLVVVVGAVVLRQARRPVLGTIALIAVATVAIGYWTGFRKTEVNEDVAMASMRATQEQRDAALAPSTDKPAADEPAEEPAREKPAAKEPEAQAPSAAKPAGPKAGTDGQEADEPAAEKPAVKPSGPVELSGGKIVGRDGHAAQGAARVLATADGKRVLTLTDFDADPGPDVDVYLSTTEGGIDDAVRLGNLKGSAGNQQYAIPSDTDLKKYSALVIWCHPFTTRIATAALR